MTGKGTHRNPLHTRCPSVVFSAFLLCTPACLRTKVRVLPKFEGSWGQETKRRLPYWLCQLQSEGSAVVSFHWDYTISSLPLAALIPGTRLRVNTQSVPAETSSLLNSCGEGGKGRINFQIIRLTLYGS